ncbi:NAD(P)/FAD-dependent oxidoreductase [Thalassococcus lentus]|uniref:FAD-binding oxidoreductase n=1 Tax=Thalassococcus lentus TaxID=1210524 RepID=A0ABT4XTS8_9RHOB|nr:FAD-binding oxidoreductase [Thalassococcus lentus]MDA7425376.1 FAD-binding oxidoreductase [Thalassococcus lentus]
MNLLFANDTRGAYPQSWYAATAEPLEPFAPLKGQIKADVCIVGGGFTGLSAALHLAKAGQDVVLIDAHRVGFGASGRNGGQLGSGQRQDQQALETSVGKEDARKFWELGEAAKQLVRDLVCEHSIECYLRDGIADAATSPAAANELVEYAEHMDRNYGYAMDVLDKDGFAALCPSPDYHGGIVDQGAAHLHPLRLALGLAQAAAKAGVRIYERTLVHEIHEGNPVTVQCEAGRVQADHLILACNGYLGGLNRQVAARVMPINNFIVATEPLGSRTTEVLTQDIAVADDRFVVNYFRLSHDGRLLFGGGESYGYRFPNDIRAVVRKPLLKVFPHLHDVKLDYAWGGTLGITVKRMPYMARPAANILNASGYSGHGVGNAIQAGKMMADAVAGQSSGFDTFAALRSPRFPGGGTLRSPILALAMTWYALRDRLGV